MNFCGDNRFQNGDLDFDGIAYRATSWPNGSPNVPQSVRFAGPFMAGAAPYPQIQFETAAPGSEFLCNFATQFNCVVPPLGARFYPFWTLTNVKGQGIGHGLFPTGARIWNFGNVIPKVTTRTFAKDAEYGAASRQGPISVSWHPARVGAMNVGFGLPVSGAWATPDNISRFATLADASGYSSLWTFQRLLVPADSAMEAVYHSVLDPMAALAYAAAVTARIRLGVAVVNAPYVSPGYLAKQAASVDVLSSGRLDLGIGLGWMPEEFAMTGAPMERRGARAAEYVQVLHAIWGDQPVEFSGEFYTVPRGTVLPRPAQPGGPPILLGGTAAVALRRAGRIADGWITSSRANLSKISEHIQIVHDAAADSGRDPSALRIICRGVIRWREQARDDAGGRQLLSGDRDQIREDLTWLAGQGVTEVFCDLNWDPRVGAPEADPRAASDRAEEILEALAPASWLSSAV